jgi:hypothetical protein
MVADRGTIRMLPVPLQWYAKGDEIRRATLYALLRA